MQSISFAFKLDRVLWDIKEDKRYSMKIGITERGDAGINLSWYDKLNTCDGAIIISKNFTDAFKEKVLSTPVPVILHCTCTGYGGTSLEPNVPEYKAQLDALKDIIDSGFPAERCVLRVDPIFPSEKGLLRIELVLQYFMELDMGINRIRISIVDEYPHVKARYRKRGWKPLYGSAFQPSATQLQMVADRLSKYPYIYETCAEPMLAYLADCFVEQGCISNVDLNLMGLPEIHTAENPQRRKGCHCLSCKTELLNARHPCSNGCVYCYWQNG